MPLAVGQTFAGYRILRRLGSGGMGEVYLAQHPRLRRLVALKVLSADVSANADYRARFALEADLASELDHPNIVVVHDRDEEDGQLWISMNYVDGLDAARLLTDKFPSGMPPQQVAKIITEVASALDYAHSRRLVHRDVKPANIMITTDEQRILLADFGIACSLKEIRSLTAKGFVVATVPYAAPEQLKGQKLDGRADQYALAKTAYELLTGSQLFPHSLAEKPTEHTAFDAVLATALAEKPEDRFSSCTEFAQALTLAQRGAWAVSPSGTLHPKQNGGGGPQQPSGRATRPTTSETPTASEDNSVYIPYDGRDVGGRRARWPITIGIVMVLFLLAIAFFVRPWQQHDRSASPNTGTPIAPTPAITFEGMRDFVNAYYADLPTHPEVAWAKLDSHCQNQTGLRDYLDFWATIQSVTVVSVSPRDATSVIAQLKYVRRDGQKDTEDRWFKMALVNGAILLDESDRTAAAGSTSPSLATPSAPATGRTFPASAIDTVLLTPAEINTLVAKNSDPLFQIKQSTYGMRNDSNLVSPSACAGVIFTAEHAIFNGTGFTAMHDEALELPTNGGYDVYPTGPDHVEQTVVVYPAAQQAQAVLTSSQPQWQSCATGRVRLSTVGQNGENGKTFELGTVQFANNQLSVPMVANSQESGNVACQQVMTVRANVVVSVRSCGSPQPAPGQYTITLASVQSHAATLAQAIADKITA